MAGHAAARHAVRADLAAGLERGPEAEERPEREREQHAIAGARRGPPRTPTSSSRAPTASWRWCRASAADVRSSTRSGGSACRRSIGSVCALPQGGCASWSAISSALVVNGSPRDAVAARRARRRRRRPPRACACRRRCAPAMRVDQRLQALRLPRGQGARVPLVQAAGGSCDGRTEERRDRLRDRDRAHGVVGGALRRRRSSCRPRRPARRGTRRGRRSAGCAS